MTLTIRTRAFLISSATLLACLAATFAGTAAIARNKVREQLRQSLGERERAVDRERGEAKGRIGRLVEAVAEGSGLKAAVNLSRELAGNTDARLRRQLANTLDGQIGAFNATIGYDFSAIADPAGRIFAASLPGVENSGSGPLIELRGRLYEVSTVPINIGDENLGSLRLGRRFKLPAAAGDGHSILLHGREIVQSTMPGLDQRALLAALRPDCIQSAAGCEVRLLGETWLIQQIRRSAISGDYRLFKLQSIDRAAMFLMSSIETLFLKISAAALVLVFGASLVLSSSISRPIQAFVDQLDSWRGEQIGGEFPANSRVHEVNILAAAFNRSSGLIQTGRQQLESAYMSFVQTLTEVLDARDRYTAGHSLRVGDYAVLIGRQLGCSAAELETLWVGATLHDIGKIGVPDSILQKPGRLTEAEFEIIKEHPAIGRRMVDPLKRFADYVPLIELHHENFDGTGYPHGLSGDQIPLLARILHVADAYDAMTSDRAYRKRMPEERVRDILQTNAGTQFDPLVVYGFIEMLHSREELKEMEEEVHV